MQLLKVTSIEFHILIEGEKMNPRVSKEEIVELTTKLVQCPSVNPPGDTTGCAKIILDKFKENNINAEIIQGKDGACNVVATLAGRNKGKVAISLR